MSDISDSMKIKMLAEAGFPPIPLQEKYLKLVEFLKLNVKHDNQKVMGEDFYVDLESEETDWDQFTQWDLYLLGQDKITDKFTTNAKKILQEIGEME